MRRSKVRYESFDGSRFITAGTFVFGLFCTNRRMKFGPATDSARGGSTRGAFDALLFDGTLRTCVNVIRRLYLSYCPYNAIVLKVFPVHAGTRRKVPGTSGWRLAQLMNWRGRGAMSRRTRGYLGRGRASLAKHRDTAAVRRTARI